MRPFSTIGWLMCQAIGTMQLDRDASPSGLVARAWAADVELCKTCRDLGCGESLCIGCQRAAVNAGMGDGPHPSLRRMYEKDETGDIQAILRLVKENLERQREREALLANCPQCGKPCPKSKVDDLHGVCDDCYWENEL